MSALRCPFMTSRPFHVSSQGVINHCWNSFLWLLVRPVVHPLPFPLPLTKGVLLQRSLLLLFIFSVGLFQTVLPHSPSPVFTLPVSHVFVWSAACLVLRSPFFPSTHYLKLVIFSYCLVLITIINTIAIIFWLKVFWVKHQCAASPIVAFPLFHRILFFFWFQSLRLPVPICCIIVVSLKVKLQLLLINTHKHIPPLTLNKTVPHLASRALSPFSVPLLGYDFNLNQGLILRTVGVPVRIATTTAFSLSLPQPITTCCFSSECRNMYVCMQALKTTDTTQLISISFFRAFLALCM